MPTLEKTTNNEDQNCLWFLPADWRQDIEGLCVREGYTTECVGYDACRFYQDSGHDKYIKKDGKKN